MPTGTVVAQMLWKWPATLWLDLPSFPWNGTHIWHDCQYENIWSQALAENLLLFCWVTHIKSTHNDVTLHLQTHAPHSSPQIGFYLLYMSINRPMLVKMQRMVDSRMFSPECSRHHTTSSKGSGIVSEEEGRKEVGNYKETVFWSCTWADVHMSW